eukprot:g8085.t1
MTSGGSSSSTSAGTSRSTKSKKPKQKPNLHELLDFDVGNGYGDEDEATPMTTAGSSPHGGGGGTSTASFHETEQGVTRKELIAILQKVSDQELVAKECLHMGKVLAQEQKWKEEQRLRVEQELENAAPLEENEITEFARNLVGITKQAPVRMSLAERQVWKILEASLEVSEYTDKIDVLHRGSKQDLIVEQILELCNCIAGMLVSNSYERASKTFSNNFIGENELLFQRVFELGRRAKILNPGLMRSTYGKMMWLLMDANLPGISKSVKFECVPQRGKTQVRTVYELLMEKNREDAEAFLKEPLLEVAIKEVVEEKAGSREEVVRAVERKKKAVETIISKYGRRAPAASGVGTSATGSVADWMREVSSQEEQAPSANGRPRMTQVEVETVLNSLQDYYAYQEQYVTPVEKMLGLLDRFFSPQEPKTRDADLTIRSGHEGSCLSHKHQTHYLFVSQSLTLWRHIMKNMTTLWHSAEKDMLNSRYRLTDTGQGLNRLQSAPEVSGIMSQLLSAAQREVARKGQSWVGLSVVHLGDRDVPNALVFIDKYTQVPRILSPIVKVIEKLPALYAKSARMKQYVDSGYGSCEGAQKAILRDFFRHGYDGSGDDGGSCVDGRLTSCWNWCSQIEKTPYFNLFLLCGFHGFDG